MNRVQLPFDIWECISAYIPEGHLRTLYGVNRALHYAAMNRKYRLVELNDFDDEKMLLLERLKDPAVARRVKVIHVDTFCVFTSHHHRGSTIYSPDEILQAMIGALAEMHNIHEFHVKWRDHIFQHDLIPFLAAAWKCVSRTVRLLDITAPAGRYRTILGMVGHHEFPSLQSIRLLLDRTTDTHGDDPSQIVASFINTARLTLESLSVKSHVDFNGAIISLGTFPLMHRLSLVLPSLDSDTLSCFFNQHSDTLRDLRWSLSAGDIDLADSELDETIGKLCLDNQLEYMKALGVFVTPFSYQSALNAVTRSIHTITRLHFDGLAFDIDQLQELSSKFKHGGVLEHLDLVVDVLALDIVEVLSTFPASLISMRLAFRHMLSVEQWSVQERVSSSTLTHHLRHLDVQGVTMYLSFEGAQVLLDAFVYYMDLSSSLESLNLVVHTLNPQLVEILAKSVPNIHTLWLRIIEFEGEDASDRRWTTPLGAFQIGMKGRSFPAWQLQDIRITSTYLDGTNVRRSEHTDILNVLAQSIPGMQH